MKLSVRLYRTVSIPTSHVAGVVGLDSDDFSGDTKLSEIEEQLRKEFYPFARGLRMFMDRARTVVGIEAMAFDVSDVSAAVAGLVDTDPAKPEDVARLDGALESEMSRMGLSVEFENFEWRLAYDTRGN
jgi:hypothetical protein